MDSETFELLDSLVMETKDSQTREPEQIVGMVKSEDENIIAIISGKTLVTQEQKFSQVFVLQRQPDNRYKLLKKIDAKVFEPYLDEANMTFMF